MHVSEIDAVIQSHSFTHSFVFIATYKLIFIAALKNIKVNTVSVGDIKYGAFDDTIFTMSQLPKFTHFALH